MDDDAGDPNSPVVHGSLRWKTRRWLVLLRTGWVGFRFSGKPQCVWGNQPPHGASSRILGGVPRVHKVALRHSARSVVTGSTRAARQAGTAQAITAIPMSRAMTPA